MNKAIIMYAPPGAGKGTQAKLLVEKFYLVHFDTGAYIENLVHDPVKLKSKTVQRERRIYDTGTLNTPSWVLKIVKQHTKEIHDAGLGVVFSGSPRTMFEAFGDAKTEGFISFLTRAYGKENIIFIQLIVDASKSVLRNNRRLVCSMCRSSVLGIYHHLKICPSCGGKLVKRTLDNPEKHKMRIEQYIQRTKPILQELRRHGYRIVSIDGTPMPYAVFRNIVKKI